MTLNSKALDENQITLIWKRNNSKKKVVKQLILNQKNPTGENIKPTSSPAPMAKDAS